MSRVFVTGGAGKAGRAVVRDLLDHGYDVVSVDLRQRLGYEPEYSWRDAITS